jgi:EF-hand domain-containing protein 1
MAIPNKQKQFFSSPSNTSLSYDPALIYGRTKKQQVAPFRPHFVLYDKKTLKFMGFFRQHVPESRVEHYRVRYVNIFYYLEDDTMTVIEPTVKVKIYDHIMSK